MLFWLKPQIHFNGCTSALGSAEGAMPHLLSHVSLLAVAWRVSKYLAVWLFNLWYWCITQKTSNLSAVSHVCFFNVMPKVCLWFWDLFGQRKTNKETKEAKSISYFGLFFIKNESKLIWPSLSWIKGLSDWSTRSRFQHVEQIFPCLILSAEAANVLWRCWRETGTGKWSSWSFCPKNIDNLMFNDN